MNIEKVAPWLVAVALAVGAGFLWVSGRQKDETIAKQAAEIQRLTDSYSTLEKDASARVEALTKEANEKLAYANLPVVPVKLTTMKPLFDSGLALQIRNTSDKTIAIDVSVERPSDGKTKDFEFTIDGGLGRNIGQSEGWAFISGDKVTITQPEHKPATLTVQ